MTVATTTLAAFCRHGWSCSSFAGNGLVADNDLFGDQRFINHHGLTRRARSTRLTFTWWTRCAFGSGCSGFGRLVDLAAATHSLQFLALTVATVAIAIAATLTTAWIAIALTTLRLALTRRAVLALTLVLATSAALVHRATFRLRSRHGLRLHAKQCFQPGHEAGWLRRYDNGRRATTGLTRTLLT